MSTGLLTTTRDGKILYSVAYERGLKKAGILYLHAKDAGDARSQVLTSRFLRGCHIAAIAPAIGFHYDDPETSKDADKVQLLAL